MSSIAFWGKIWKFVKTKKIRVLNVTFIFRICVCNEKQSKAYWTWETNFNVSSELFKTQTHKILRHTQTICRLLPTNYLSMFDHFVGLALKGLTSYDLVLKKFIRYPKNIHLKIKYQWKKLQFYTMYTEN